MTLRMRSSIEIRRLVDRQIKALHLGEDFDAWRFIQAYSRAKGIKTKLSPIVVPAEAPDFFGAYVRMGEQSIIAFRVNTSWLHQNRILAHEGGHLLLHEPLQGEVLMRGMSRAAQEEREAEVFASYLLERMASGALVLEPVRRPRIANISYTLEEFFASLRGKGEG